MGSKKSSIETRLCYSTPYKVMLYDLVLRRKYDASAKCCSFCKFLVRFRGTSRGIRNSLENRRPFQDGFLYNWRRDTKRHYSELLHAMIMQSLKSLLVSSQHCILRSGVILRSPRSFE